MSSLEISSIVFGCLCAGGALGLILGRTLPEQHLSHDSRELVKLGVGLVGTMGALVLGLMVGSAKSGYDAQKHGTTQLAVSVIMLDRALAHFGPETKDTRSLLHDSMVLLVESIWSEEDVLPAHAKMIPTTGGEELYDRIHLLEPKNEAQRALKIQALNAATEIGQTRWTLYQQLGRSFPDPFLIVMVSWFSIVFLGFGVLAPRNATAIVTLMLCALSVAGAVLLILELDRPFDGLIHISPEGLRHTVASLGQ